MDVRPRIQDLRYSHFEGLKPDPLNTRFEHIWINMSTVEFNHICTVPARNKVDDCSKEKVCFPEVVRSKPKCHIGNCSIPNDLWPIWVQEGSPMPCLGVPRSVISTIPKSENQILYDA